MRQIIKKDIAMILSIIIVLGNISFSDANDAFDNYMIIRDNDLIMDDNVNSEDEAENGNG